MKSPEFKKFIDSQGAKIYGVYGAKADEMVKGMEQRFSWFLRQLVESLAMVDERFLGSLGRLLFRPGRLDRDWLEGRNARAVTGTAPRGLNAAIGALLLQMMP